MGGNNSGGLINYDFVIVNTGTQLNCKFSLNAGIKCETRINVNARMEPCIPGIYDVGDVPLFNNVNQGLWAPSSEMGKVVSAKLLVVINHSHSHQNLCH